MTGGLIGVLLALAPLDSVRVETVDGLQVSGVVSAIEPGLIVVHDGAGLHTRVDLASMQAVELSGTPITLEALDHEIQQYLTRRYGPQDQPSPSPDAVAAASLLWPGAGHRMLGEQKSFASYAVADAVVLGLAVGLAAGRQSASEALPLFALSAAFRIYSAAEARKIARIRQKMQPRTPHQD